MRSPNTLYLSRLDHLRFYAAALVVLFHYVRHFVPQTVFNNPVASLIAEGHIGIGLFMVLSGFIFSVIAQGKTIQYGRFIFNRFIRIYPLYGFAAVLAVTLMVYNKQMPLGALDVIAWLLAFRPPTIAELPQFYHLWTIPVEFSFYLLFPFLHTFFTRYGVRYFLCVIGLFLLVRAGVYLEFGTVRFLAYETLFGRLDQFLIGYIAAWMYVNGYGRRVFARPVTLLVAVVLLLFSVRWLNHQGGSTNFEASWWVWWTTAEGLVWALVVMCYMALDITWPKWLDRPLARMGELSFSIYVCHLFIVTLLAKYVGVLTLTSNTAMNATLTALILALPATLLLSNLTFRIIEKPFLDFRVVYVKAEDAE